MTTKKKTPLKKPRKAYANLLERASGDGVRKPPIVLKKGMLLSINDGMAVYMGQVRQQESDGRWEVEILHAVWGANVIWIDYNFNHETWKGHTSAYGLGWNIFVDPHPGTLKDFLALRAALPTPSAVKPIIKDFRQLKDKHYAR